MTRAGRLLFLLKGGHEMRYFDCHADTLTEIRNENENLSSNTCDLDLNRVQKFADTYTQIFAIWKNRKEMDETAPEEEFLMLYERAAALLGEADSRICWCRTAEDMEEAHRAGKAAAFLSLEDVSIAGKYSTRLKELGFSFAMLTWNYENEFACGAVPGPGTAPAGRGLTKKGRELVRVLADQGIILDISHLSDQGAEDLFSITEAPVIASHSNVRSVCAHPRNLPDSLIHEIIRRKGLIGMNFFAPFVGEYSGIEGVLRHVDAVLSMGGENVLALGADFDGCSGQFPPGITGVESIPELKRYMEAAGLGAELTDKILCGNAEAFIKRNAGKG